MTTDPTILAALAEAVKKDPTGVPLRLHLASLLLASGDENAALEHYVAILGFQPANTDALDGAAKSAAAVGDNARAQGFRQLLDAMKGKPPTPPQEVRSSPTAESAPVERDPEPARERVGAEAEDGQTFLVGYRIS